MHWKAKKKISDHSEIFFCFPIHKKLNKSCYMHKKNCAKKKFFWKFTVHVWFSRNMIYGDFEPRYIRYAVVVLGSEHEFLFKSTSTHCAVEEQKERIIQIYFTLLKFTYVFSITWCFMLIVFLVLALNLLVNNQLNSSMRHLIVTNIQCPVPISKF